jgi:hypothetical protein
MRGAWRRQFHRCFKDATALQTHTEVHGITPSSSRVARVAGTVQGPLPRLSIAHGLIGDTRGHGQRNHVNVAGRERPAEGASTGLNLTTRSGGTGWGELERAKSQMLGHLDGIGARDDNTNNGGGRRSIPRVFGH